jgi:putative flippase GtrA
MCGIQVNRAIKPTKAIGREIISFGIVGVINTIIGLAIMFGLYNLLHAGYWISTAVSYVIGSIVSYILNKKFTFRHEGDVLKSLVKFALNIAVCYAIAYSVAKPVVIAILSSFDIGTSAVEQIAMIFGMILFTGLNFLGQRFFAFRKKNVS